LICINLPFYHQIIYASERLSWQEEGRYLCYQLPKPLPNGQTQLRLKLEEFLDHLSMLLPRPRGHRHSYHGVLAANARLISSQKWIGVMTTLSCSHHTSKAKKKIRMGKKDLVDSKG